MARGLLRDWDDGVAVVRDAAAQDARVLRVGTLTSIGRALYPAITDQFAKRQPGWHVDLHTCGWGDPTAGVQDRTADAAFVWLPIDAAEIETEVLATEPRFVAISARHPLADRPTIEFSEIAGEPVAALPASAGSQRDFWLAVDARAGQPPRIAAEVSSADEKFEIVSSGAAITLLAQGNADIYSRDGIVCIPVSGLEPASAGGRLAARRPQAPGPGLRPGLPRRCRRSAAPPSGHPFRLTGLGPATDVACPPTVPAFPRKRLVHHFTSRPRSRPCHDGIMGSQRFRAVIAAGPGDSAVVTMPFDPDAAWGAKANHPVSGTIGGCRVRSRL